MPTIGLLLAVAQAHAMQVPSQETVHLPKFQAEISETNNPEATTIAWSRGGNCTPYGLKPGTLSARCN